MQGYEGSILYPMADYGMDRYMSIVILWKGNKKTPKIAFRSFENFFKLAVRTGLEPVTPCVTGMYSNQLN